MDLGERGGGFGRGCYNDDIEKHEQPKHEQPHERAEVKHAPALNGNGILRPRLQ